MHRVLKAETARPPAANLIQQQRIPSATADPVGEFQSQTDQNL